ncbi:MAG: alpha-amylase family glycosyl hydrolase, partial [Gemmatimonadales bacterium]
MPNGAGVRFRVWAPAARRLEVVVESQGTFAMEAQSGGYWEAHVPELTHGTLYRYRLDEDRLWPDPASRFQPEGVHGPSMVVDPRRHRWRDEGWPGLPVERLVFYELHVGTFTPEGTFEGVRRRLLYLKDLGVTALALLPVAEFPGRWNWGYDPAAPFATAQAYGTPDDLRALVDAAHTEGLAVFLDVV